VDLYLHSPNTPSWRGAQLKEKHRDIFTFYTRYTENMAENKFIDDMYAIYV